MADCEPTYYKCLQIETKIATLRNTHDITFPIECCMHASAPPPAQTKERKLDIMETQISQQSLESGAISTLKNGCLQHASVRHELAVHAFDMYTCTTASKSGGPSTAA